ncbi:MAG: hypothetical protein CM15mP9_3320 [Methanobacteriota archaeon]|nr:MAG: hypothetical protein CM15mP9_3320 [Euryarchaeota archaeon]
MFQSKTLAYHFRIQPRLLFVPGNGTLGVRVIDIDEIMSVSFLIFEFLHSPPEINVDHPDNISNAGLLEILVEMSDADGIDAVCMADYYQDGNVIYSVLPSEVMDLDDSGFWSSSWLLPTNISGDISFDLSCEDWSGNQVNYTSSISVDEPVGCVEDCGQISKKRQQESSESYTIPITVDNGILAIILVSAIISFVIAARKRNLRLGVTKR